MGGASEAAFTWDQLIDCALNGQLRVQRTVSVEDGHMVAQPEVQSSEGGQGLQGRSVRCTTVKEGEPRDSDLEALAAANCQIEADLGGLDIEEPAGGGEHTGNGARTAGFYADDGTSVEVESLGSTSSSMAGLSYVQVHHSASHSAQIRKSCWLFATYISPAPTFSP